MFIHWLSFRGLTGGESEESEGWRNKWTRDFSREGGPFSHGHSFARELGSEATSVPAWYKGALEGRDPC